MIQRLPMALAYVKGSNIYDNLLNEIIRNKCFAACKWNYMTVYNYKTIFINSERIKHLIHIDYL